MGLTPLSPKKSSAPQVPFNPLNAQQVLQSMPAPSFDSFEPSTPTLNAALHPINTLNAEQVLQGMPRDVVKPPTFKIEPELQPDIRALAAPNAAQDPQPQTAAPEKKPAPTPMEKMFADVAAAMNVLAKAILDFAASLKGLFDTKPAPKPKAEEEPKPEPKPEDKDEGVDGPLVKPLQAIAGDPEGQKLIQLALKAGLKGIHVGKLDDGVMGETNDGNIVISPEALKNPADVVRTLAHELGHAVTPDNGTSVAEEKGVDKIAKRIQERVQPGDTFELNDDAYGDLEKDNGYEKAMSDLGFAV